jgi:hypothetical protein
MIMKLDLSKVCGRCILFYLRLVLIHIGFFVHMVNWIMGCLYLVSIAILINGSTSGFFNPTRGLRYKLPLSPLLFFHCSISLCRSIIEAK